MRITLGDGDMDCRPGYAADPDDWIVKAIVAVEDGTFWEHRGVRPLSIVRAAFQNVLYRRRVSGASTISMQTVRLMRPHPKSLWWKFREAVLALKMERVKDKRWIMTQYLNRAPFGANFIGVEAAANGWFGKGVKDLGLGEAALLAGMVQAPSRFRPDRNMDRALKRRRYVLERMLALGMIDEAQREGADGVRPVIRRAKRPFRNPHFCNFALRHLDSLGGRQRIGGDLVTTLDQDVQILCDNAVNSAAERGGYSSAAVVMRTDTGAVVALSCNGDYFDAASSDAKVNTALCARPAGSTLKPFLAALAMDRGFVSPDERLFDIPKSYQGYSPANFDAKYRGLIPLRDALVLSLNLPFVQMLQRIGVDGFRDTLRDLGFRSVGGSGETFGLGMAIGNVEVSLMELVAAYGAIARGGEYRAPCAFKNEAEEERGRHSVEVFTPGVCYLVSDMLSGRERTAAALGHVADVDVPRFAWKTGTSAAYRDAWTVLWNPEYVIGVWCGHKRGGFGDTSLVGAKAAAPVAWRIARMLYLQNSGPWYSAPDDVVRRKVCSLSGMPANGDCPSTEIGWAVTGGGAASLCSVHRRDFDGKVVERIDSFLGAFAGLAKRAESLSILKPENGAKFVLVNSSMKQRIVCKVAGNPAGGRLWWFVDGAPTGETVGTAPFVADMTAGTHEIACSTAEGVSASVTVHVVPAGR